MRILPPLMLSATLLLLAAAPVPVSLSLTGVAAAQAPDALVQKCRKAVFRQYGRREVKGDRRVLVMRKNQVLAAVDQCVANGGRVM